MKKEKEAFIQNNDSDSDKSNCTHWGITRWFYGIKEYLVDRPCGNFEIVDYDRTYCAEVESIIITTDCLAYVGYNQILCSPIIDMIICCPLATSCHLLCLPFACCSFRSDICYGGDTSASSLSSSRNIIKSTESYSYPIYNSNSNSVYDSINSMNEYNMKQCKQREVMNAAYVNAQVNAYYATNVNRGHYGSLAGPHKLYK